MYRVLLGSAHPVPGLDKAPRLRALDPPLTSPQSPTQQPPACSTTTPWSPWPRHAATHGPAEPTSSTPWARAGVVAAPRMIQRPGPKHRARLQPENPRRQRPPGWRERLLAAYRRLGLSSRGWFRVRLREFGLTTAIRAHRLGPCTALCSGFAVFDGRGRSAEDACRVRGRRTIGSQEEPPHLRRWRGKTVTGDRLHGSCGGGRSPARGRRADAAVGKPGAERAGRGPAAAQG